jgi:hypothetical protein
MFLLCCPQPIHDMVQEAISIGRRFIMTHGDSYDILVSTNGNYPFSTLLYVSIGWGFFFADLLLRNYAIIRSRHNIQEGGKGVISCGQHSKNMGLAPCRNRSHKIQLMWGMLLVLDDVGWGFFFADLLLRNYAIMRSRHNIQEGGKGVITIC